MFFYPWCQFINMQSLFRSSPVVSSLLCNSLFGSSCGCMDQFTHEHSVHPSRQCQALPDWSILFAPARFTHYSHPCVLDGTQHPPCRSWSSSIRFHMGEALFVGWLASCLLCTAGLLQCCSGPLVRAGEETSIAESSSHSDISLDTLFSSASLDSHANACISEL